MTTTAWAHLPNARHIDAVMAHAKAHPEMWRTSARDAARDAAWDDAWATAWGDARDAACGAARTAAWVAARGAARAAARGAAWGACLALIAWDDAGLLMGMPGDAVRTLAAAGHHPAVLLLPARLAMEETP